MIKSTGLRNHLLATGSLKAALDGGVIRIYSGAVPADADASIASAVLLCTVSLTSTGAGINLATTATGGVILKASAEVWSGNNVADGTASFFRFSGLADAAGLSTTEKRIQGTVGLAGADLNLSSVTLVTAAEQKVNYAAFAVSV